MIAGIDGLRRADEHGGHGHAASAFDIAQAGTQTAVITIDIPTIVQHGSHDH